MRLILFLSRSLGTWGLRRRPFRRLGRRPLRRLGRRRLGSLGRLWLAAPRMGLWRRLGVSSLLPPGILRRLWLWLLSPGLDRMGADLGECLRLSRLGLRRLGLVETPRPSSTPDQNAPTFRWVGA